MGRKKLPKEKKKVRVWYFEDPEVYVYMQTLPNISKWVRGITMEKYKKDLQ